MQRSTIFGAEDVKASDLCRLKPHDAIPTGQDIRFHSKRGEKKTVNHIFGRHRDANRTIDGNMQLVDFALTSRMLKFPHPLLACRVDVERIVRHACEPEVEP